VPMLTIRCPRPLREALRVRVAKLNATRALLGVEPISENRLVCRLISLDVLRSDAACRRFKTELHALDDAERADVVAFLESRKIGENDPRPPNHDGEDQRQGADGEETIKPVTPDARPRPDQLG